MGIEQQLTAVVEASDRLTQEVSGKIGEIDQKVAMAEQKTDDFIAKARSEYIRFTHYVPLPAKLIIPPLGLSDVEIDSFSYQDRGDYTLQDEAGNNCFGDIVEFANGFNQLPMPQGMFIYLHLLVNVDGHPDIFQTTKVHFLRYSNAHSGFHVYNDPTTPFLLKNENGSPVFSIRGRNWGDSYKDRNTLKIGAFRNHQSDTTLRIVNMGEKQLEVFGIGVEVRA
ncbi:hypothetical protein [Grimontia hollisae]|uniref:hypothetical protein n=1 Tax=Grimontia hollisae TaxID=673 RepID=UPI0013032F25|nr:hypothetical protein [Grimontia hollisae]